MSATRFSVITYQECVILWNMTYCSPWMPWHFFWFRASAQILPRSWSWPSGQPGLFIWTVVKVVALSTRTQGLPVCTQPTLTFKLSPYSGPLFPIFLGDCHAIFVFSDFSDLSTDLGHSISQVTLKNERNSLKILGRFSIVVKLEGIQDAVGPIITTEMDL